MLVALGGGGDAERRARHVAASTDAYNEAAERHWARMAADPQARRAQQQKPFANPREAPAMLYRLGLALEALDLGVGQAVLDFGAGSCWLSLALNRLGCRTVSIDISRTALALGAEALGRDPYARSELEPRFMTYDGRTLPLPDASVDRAICFDAFHHVPNPNEILPELFRVLRPGGRLVMAEPGAGHAAREAALFESTHYGVLENELVLEDLLTVARRAGFEEFELKPYPDVDNLVLPAEAHLGLLAGDHSLYPMDHVVASMRELHVVAMLKPGARRDSRNPGTLEARIDTLGVARVQGHAGKEVSIPIRIVNLGDTLWLAEQDHVGGGYVSLGGHLQDGNGAALAVGHFTQRLPRDVAPGETVEMLATFGLPEVAGRFTIRLDLVDDRVAWFSQVGSPTTDLELQVVWSDSSDPHRFEARIEPTGPFPPTARDAGFSLHLRITNTGDTRWVDGPPGRRGTVCVGVQRVRPDGEIVERDYFRIPLPCAVTPGESVEIRATVPLRPGAGRHFAIDLVAEHICWFFHHGSRCLSFEVGD
jgi:SAM-dependent methyltransferase